MRKIVLFQGDSITDACRSRELEYAAGHGYPTLVKARMGFDEPDQYLFFNRGVGGDRIVDLYARMKKDIINLKPDVLSVLIGINDVWHEIGSKNGVCAQKFEMVYDLLLSEVKEQFPDIRILILEPFVLRVPGSGTDNTEEDPTRWEYFHYETMLRSSAAKRVAKKHGAIFIPLQDAFDELCKLAPPSYWLIDGVHPTAMGHELIAREWLKAYKSIYE